MKILLIEASIFKTGKWPAKGNPGLTVFPGLALPLLAALTPTEHEVRILIDTYEKINFEEKIDLVGITFHTAATARAYEIADRFREKGNTVVMGGIHVSTLPDEAAAHADAIVIGEAEEIWQRLLEDFQKGSLKKRYKADGFVDMAKIPKARLDLLNKKHFWVTKVIQASRGCALGCEFCSIEKIFGKKPRFRPVEDVIDEIKGMSRRKVVVFTDDNLAMNPSYVKELFRELIPLKINWMGEASWTIGNNPELLTLIKKSGGFGLIVGFESIREQTHTKKVSRYKDNRQAYTDAIRNLHKNRILVLGAFIFGFDNDDSSVFGETLEFLLKADIDFVEISLMMPFPETPLYQRLSSEGRILSRDWTEYNYKSPGKIFKLKNLTPEEVNENIKKLYLKFYSLKRMVPRFIRQIFRYRNLKLLIAIFFFGVAYRRKARFLNSIR
jgi:radical SAM superfamily enzyme YgiQ (UPF0313 family)